MVRDASVTVSSACIRESDLSVATTISAGSLRPTLTVGLPGTGKWRVIAGSPDLESRHQPFMLSVGMRARGRGLPVRGRLGAARRWLAAQSAGGVEWVGGPFVMRCRSLHLCAVLKSYSTVAASN